MRSLCAVALIASSVFVGCAFGVAEPARFLSHDGARVDGSLFTSRTSGSVFRYVFEYGKTTSYGAQFGHGAIAYGYPNDRFDISTRLTGLEPGTTYHYRLCAFDDDNPNTPGCVGDQTFTTPTTTGPALTLVPTCVDPSGHRADGVDVTGTGFPTGSPQPGDSPRVGHETTANGVPSFIAKGVTAADEDGEVEFGSSWPRQGTVDYFETVAWLDPNVNFERDPGEPILARGRLDQTCDD